MIKLSLSPDLRFANDKLVNRKAEIALGSAAFKGTFSIMPASASTQAAITAECHIGKEDVVIKGTDLAGAEKNKVALTANVIKTVHFKKGQEVVDTGIALKVDNSVESPVVENFSVVTEGYSFIASEKNTLSISRTNYTEAETAEVELANGDGTAVAVATGSLVGNTMGFAIKGGDETVRIHALCNWMGHDGLKKNLESFKMVKKDHDALVLSLETNSANPAESVVYEDPAS